MSTSQPLTKTPGKRVARMVAGVALVAVLSAACGQGDADSTVSANPQSAPPAHLEHGAVDQQALGQTAGSTADGGAKLRQALTAGLQEHEYLAGIAVVQAVLTKKTDSPEFTAAAAALDKNSVALSEAIASVYGKAAGDSFLPLWRKHIGFFVDYTVGKLTNDTAKSDKAKTDLDGYRADFGAFLSSANPNLPKEAVAEALIPHVTATFAAIDGVVAGDNSGFEKLRVAAGHMPMLANTIAGAIGKQYPDKFPGVDSAASGLLATLTAGLQEHEYLAGIAVAMATVTKDPASAPFKAAADTLDKNSVALSEAIASVYGKAAGDSFLPLWRKHIGFFVDYTVGKLTNDTAKSDKAKADLDGYRSDFGAFLSSANPNLPKEAVAEALIPHVTATLAAIDGVVSGDGSGFEKLRVAAGHMPMLATTIAGAIAQQFPEKFPAVGSGSADLPETD